MVSTPIIVALDYFDKETALAMARQLDPALCRVKVASTLYTRYGPVILEELHAMGFEVFLDLKYHDIPNQVAGSCEQAARLGVWMLTIHCCGGLAMMSAAREAVDKVSGRRPLLIGVTVLTSLSSEDLSEIGYRSNVIDSVSHFASLAKRSGLDGVVSSAAEVSVLRHEIGEDFVYVTPGVRLDDNSHDDQKRVMTPSKALAAGSRYLVIGRAITKAADPVKAFQKVLADLP